MFKCDQFNYNNNERKQVKDNMNICVQMLVFKCYICKNPNWHKKEEEHKTKKNQQTFYQCNMCNNTIKITLYCKKSRKKDKEHNECS